MILGVGVDIEDVKNFEDKDSRFLDRIFSPQERAYCDKHHTPALHYAVRFCAKEALIKASASFATLVISDSEVFFEDGLPVPQMKIKNPQKAESFKDKKIFLSLSHTQTYATAMVVIEGEKA